MNVLFATSMRSGDIGGPAVFAESLARVFEKISIKSSSANLPRLPFLIREIVYGAILFFRIHKFHIVYSLSGSPAVNLPIVFLKLIFRKKFLIRPGGDFLWERAIERGETDKTPHEYYASGDYKSRKVSLSLFTVCLKSADKIIFPTLYLKELYARYYGIPDNKCELIGYSFPEITEDSVRASDRNSTKQFLFAGRLIRFKNISRLIRAFSDVKYKNGAILKIVGDGPELPMLSKLVKELRAENCIFLEKSMLHADLLRELKKSYCAIVPSIFEPGSFFMHECLKLKVPVIFTKESGLYDMYSDALIFIDPTSLLDIKNKIEYLLDLNNYSNYLAQIEKINTTRTWDDVAKDHVRIFEKL